MARPRIHGYWRTKILELYEGSDRTKRAPRIRTELEQIVAKDMPPHLGGVPNEAGDVPDERTIRRILKESASLSESERKTFLYAYWPRSMEQGLLPWEASRTTLELIQIMLQRPSISQARWYYHLTLAAPDLDQHPRMVLSWLLDSIDKWKPERTRQEARHLLEQWLGKWHISLQQRPSTDDILLPIRRLAVIEARKEI